MGMQTGAAALAISMKHPQKASKQTPKQQKQEQNNNNKNEN